MNSWKVILASLVIFCAGVLTGGLLIKFSERNGPAFSQTPPPETGPRPPGGEHDPVRDNDFPRPRQPEMLNKQFLKQLDNSLKLTPGQREAIQKILADGQEKNRQIWTNVAPEMRRVMAEVRQNIKEQLTAEQLKQFEDLMKRPPRKPPGTNSVNSAFKPGNPAPTNAPAAAN